jgi:hypothetical protein
MSCNCSSLRTPLVLPTYQHSSNASFVGGSNTKKLHVELQNNISQLMYEYCGFLGYDTV